MDLTHGAMFYPACTVRAADLSKMRQADVVVAAGRGGKADESRLDLLRDNARLVAEIGRTRVGFEGTVVPVTNPVDVLTQVMAEASGLPPERVLGTGFSPSPCRWPARRWTASTFRHPSAPAGTGLPCPRSRASTRSWPAAPG